MAPAVQCPATHRQCEPVDRRSGCGDCEVELERVIADDSTAPQKGAYSESLCAVSEVAECRKACRSGTAGATSHGMDDDADAACGRLVLADPDACDLGRLPGCLATARNATCTQERTETHRERWR
jgi:hypothetical protein